MVERSDGGIVLSRSNSDIQEYYNDRYETKAETYVDISEISADTIDRIAPNGDEEFILEKIATMPEDEALNIVLKAIDYHRDDWNFPNDMMEKMKLLVLGEKQSGIDPEQWKLDLRIEAALIKYSSPYAEVRAVTDLRDDPEVPIETIRSWTLSIAWAIGGTCINTFFAPRFPNMSIGGNVIQLFLYPTGKLAELILPKWSFTMWGRKFDLNPGPWSYKEQMFATITFNGAINTVNSYNMIMVQKLDVYYGQKWVSIGYMILVTLWFQFLGLGIAGLFRRMTVYPVKTLWPGLLYTLAMNRALLKPEKKEKIHGWTISRYNFFWACFVGMFLYYWIPGYLFTALSNFNWITWIAPNNFNLAVATGTSSGLGINPWTTFDWNVANGALSPLTVPFWAIMHQFTGAVIGLFIVVGMFYSNYYYSGYLPPNSNNIFTNNATSYDINQVLSNNRFSIEKYQQYSAPFLSAGKLVQTGASFFVYPVYFLYMITTYWQLIYRGYIDMFRGFFHGRSNFEDIDDSHSRANARYKEVPDWWFLTVFVIALVLGIVCVEVYPVDTPVWYIFLLIAIALLFMGPLALLNSTSGISFGLLYLIIIITGYALPGNPNAQMIGSLLGGWGIVGQSDGFIQDLKSAHYARIPQRAAFRGHIIATLITVFVAVGLESWQMNSIEGLCTDTQASHFTCANSALSTYSSSVTWGLIGPKRIFAGIYPVLKYAFLMGFIFAVVYISLIKLGQIYGESARQHARERYSEKQYEKLEKYLFRPIAFLGSINPVLILQGVQGWCPVNMAYFIPGAYLAVFFGWFIKRRYAAWWEKYTYVMAAAFFAAVAFCAIIMFCSVQYHPKPLKWWGNTVSGAGLDGSGLKGRVPLPEKGYFGPAPGNYP